MHICCQICVLISATAAVASNNFLIIQKVLRRLDNILGKVHAMFKALQSYPTKAMEVALKKTLNFTKKLVFIWSEIRLSNMYNTKAIYMKV
jgi:hypothetical protein